MPTGSLLGLVMAWSVRIILECFLVVYYFYKKDHLRQNNGDWEFEDNETSGFPLIREIRGNFEDFFQSGKSGKTWGFQQKSGKKF